MNCKPVLDGISSWWDPRFKKGAALSTGGTGSARYCYSAWLRHRVMAAEHQVSIRSQIVAELGPGDSLGIGLAALVSGAEKYYALDIVQSANTDRNLSVLDQVIALFAQRADIPGEDEFPRLKPYLENYKFPDAIYSRKYLDECLAQSRVEKIRQSVRCPNGENSMIEYHVPWDDPEKIRRATVDLVYSQAVLEHVDDLKTAYRAMNLWLKPGGHISHQIDFKCHETADRWDGHWAHSDFIWKLIRGRRPYLINREPFSTHRRLIEENDFRWVFDKKVRTDSTLARHKLAPRFRHLPDDDLTLSGVFLLAQKK